MAETMRERMARALCKAEGQNPDAVVQTPRRRYLMWQSQRYTELTDAALAAMREPTEAMVEEGAYVLDDDVEGPSTAICTAFRKAWQAAIDTARNEQPDEEADVERSS